jgi:hypothetical protein
MTIFSAFLSASKPGTSPFCRLFQILSIPGITRGRLLPTTGRGACRRENSSSWSICTIDPKVVPLDDVGGAGQGHSYRR